jgi:hypothetical protein
MAHPKSMMPLHVQEQQLPSFPTSTSTPIIIQEPDQHEHSSGSQHTLVDDEFVEQGDHPLSQLDLSEDDGERPPLLYVGLANVEQHHSPKSKKKYSKNGGGKLPFRLSAYCYLRLLLFFSSNMTSIQRHPGAST